MEYNTGKPGTMGRAYRPLPFRMLYGILILLVLAIVAPVSADVVITERTINPGDSIMSAINISNPGDTVILNPGIYRQQNITLYKDHIIIRANTSFGHGAADTIIDAMSAGRIFNNSWGGYSFTLDNLTLRNGTAPNGGAIHSPSGGILTINSTIISNCSAPDSAGGAIYTNSGTLRIASSQFSNCSAMWGGAIFSATPISVTSSVFFNCKAMFGGAIESADTTTINSSVFSDCTATSNGGAIYAGYGSFNVISSSFSGCSVSSGQGGSAIAMVIGSGTVHYSRFYHNSGDTVSNQNASTIDATNNWWGNNSNPSEYVHNTTVSPWLVLNITATPSSVSPAQTSIIRVNLTKNSAGTDTASGGIFVPDGIPVAFARTSGTGTIAPQPGSITAGTNTTQFTPAGIGTSTVTATVDGQTVSTGITVTGSSASKIAIYRDGSWYIDMNGDGVWNTRDQNYGFGAPFWTPVAGDWNGDGKTEIGVYRDGAWYLDYDASGWWSAGDKNYGYGAPDWIPVVGDWNADGSDKIGAYRNGAWYLDTDGSGTFNAGDKNYAFGGAGWTPVVGKWTNGETRIGVYKDGIYFIDYSGDGTYGAGDKTVVYGTTGSTAITGDWNANGLTEVGTKTGKAWQLDYDGLGAVNVSTKLYSFGAAAWNPVIGNWNADGSDKIGIYLNGAWYLDENGNGVWDAGTDKNFAFGTTGWIPVVGKWS